MFPMYLGLSTPNIIQLHYQKTVIAIVAMVPRIAPVWLPLHGRIASGQPRISVRR